MSNINIIQDLATINVENTKPKKTRKKKRKAKKNSDETHRLLTMEQDNRFKSEMIAFYESIAPLTEIKTEKVKQTMTVNMQQEQPSTTAANTQENPSTQPVMALKIKQEMLSMIDVNQQQLKPSTSDVNTKPVTPINSQQQQQPTTTDVPSHQLQQPTTTDVPLQHLQQSTTKALKIKQEMLSMIDVNQQQLKPTPSDANTRPVTPINSQQQQPTITEVPSQQQQQPTITEVPSQQQQQPTTTDVPSQQQQQPTTRAVNHQPSTTYVNLQHPTTKAVTLQKSTTKAVNLQQPTTKAVTLQKSTTKAVNIQQSTTKAVNLQQSTTKAVNLQQSTTKAVNLQPSTTTVNSQLQHTAKDVDTRQVKLLTSATNTQQQHQFSDVNHHSNPLPSTNKSPPEDSYNDVIFMGITRAKRKPSFSCNLSVKEENSNFLTTSENPIVIDDNNDPWHLYSNEPSTSMNNSLSSDPYSDDVIFMGMEMTDRKPIFPFNFTIKTESKDFFNNLTLDDCDEPIVITDDITDKVDENNNDGKIYDDQNQRKMDTLEDTTSIRNTGSNHPDTVTTLQDEPAGIPRIVNEATSTMATESVSLKDKHEPAPERNQTNLEVKENQLSLQTKGNKRSKSPTEKQNNQQIDKTTKKIKINDENQSVEKTKQKKKVATRKSRSDQDYKKNGDEKTKVTQVNQTTQTMNTRYEFTHLRRVVRIYRNGRELYLKYVINFRYHKEFIILFIKESSCIRLFSKEYELSNFLQSFYDITVAPKCNPPYWIIKLMQYYMWKIIHKVNDQQSFIRRVQFLPRIVLYGGYFICKAREKSQQYAWMIMQNSCDPEDFKIYISSDPSYSYLEGIFYKNKDTVLNIYRNKLLDMEKRFIAQFINETSLLIEAN